MNPRLLVNPGAGSSRRLPAALALATRRGVDVRETRDARELATEARRAVDDGVPRLLLAGGDGTLHDALPALCGTSVAVGLVPAGRGNDFARALGLPLDPLDAVDVALDGPASRVDLGSCDGRPFAGALSAGLDAAVAERVRRRGGGSALAYRLEALRTLAAAAPGRVTLGVDGGEPRPRRAWLVAAVNSGVYGGGLRIVPGARLDDGRLDLVLVRPVGRWRLALLLGALARATHERHPAFEHRRVASVRLSLPAGWRPFADGESLAAGPDAEIRVLPSALAVAGAAVVPGSADPL